MPLRLVPIRLPRTTLPVAPEPLIRRPTIPLAEMTFPWPGLEPPIVLFGELSMEMPSKALPGSGARDPHANPVILDHVAASCLQQDSRTGEPFDREPLDRGRARKDREAVRLAARVRAVDLDDRRAVVARLRRGVDRRPGR